MGFRDRYATDKAASENGKWISKGDGLDILVRRLNSKAARKIVNEENAKHSNLTRGGKSLPMDIADKVNRKVASRALLLDWRDTPALEGEEKLYGAPRPADADPELVAAGKVPMIPFSPDVAEEYFLEYPDFLEEVIEDAASAENFRVEEREEIKGN